MKIVGKDPFKGSVSQHNDLVNVLRIIFSVMQMGILAPRMCTLDGVSLPPIDIRGNFSEHMSP